jgi:hypothetical protein
MRRAAPKAAAPAVKEPATVRNLTPDHEILIRLEDGQKALEKQSSAMNAAIQTQISELSAEIADSKRETQRMLVANSKRIDSTQSSLKIIVALLIFLCGGLLYVARQLQRLENKSFANRGDPTPEFEDEGIVSWRISERPNGQEAGSDMIAPASSPTVRAPTQRISPDRAAPRPEAASPTDRAAVTSCTSTASLNPLGLPESD